MDPATIFAIVKGISAAVDLAAKLTQAYAVARGTGDMTPEQMAAYDAQVNASHVALQQALAGYVPPRAEVTPSSAFAVHGDAIIPDPNVQPFLPDAPIVV